MTTGQIAELMGSKTTEREAEAMLSILLDHSYTADESTISEISDTEWFEMVAEAVAMVNGDVDVLF
jgi:hypothetical protein